MSETAIRSSGTRLHPLTPFIRGWGYFLAAAVVMAQNDDLRQDLRLASLVLLAVFVGGVVLGTLSWWFTRYQLTADALRVDTGFLFRRTRVIRFDRIQAIDVAQPLVARMFGMAELRMEVAGGSSSDGRLNYLTLDHARELRQTLLAVASDRRPDEPEGSGPAPMLIVPTGRLLGATLLSSTVLGSAGALVWLIVATTVLDFQVGLFAAIPLLLGVFQPIWKEVVGNHRFTLTEGREGLRIRRGLLDLRRQTVPAGRVQGLLVSEPLLWRRLGWARIDLDIAGLVGSADIQQDESNHQLLPVGTRAEVAGVLGRVMPGLDLSRITMHPAPSRAGWLRPVGWRYLAYGVDSQVLVTVQGWINRRTAIVLHHKTQSVRLVQGPLQRALALANVHVDTPAGPVHAVALHRDEREAAALLDAQATRARDARNGQIAARESNPEPPRGHIPEGEASTGERKSPIADVEAGGEVRKGPIVEGQGGAEVPNGPIAEREGDGEVRKGPIVEGQGGAEVPKGPIVEREGDGESGGLGGWKGEGTA